MLAACFCNVNSYLLSQNKFAPPCKHANLFFGHDLIIEDAPSVQRLLLNSGIVPWQITTVSAPKQETLGAIRDPFRWLKMVFGSTAIQVLYIIHVNFCNLPFSFVRIS